MAKKRKVLFFVEMARALEAFWAKNGCSALFGWDMPKGAATFSPYTFFWSLDKTPRNTAYLEPCRRPGDARYGDSPNRLGRYYQYQVFMKPAPKNIRDLYRQSLSSIGIKIENHELRYLEDDWESPTLGATGVGWEVWLDGLEITQFTYFQNFAGVELPLIPVEITYGLERIAMYLQGVDNIFDIQWDNHLKYGDIFHKDFEKEFSKYHFEQFDAVEGFRAFEQSFKEVGRLVDQGLVLPAHEEVMRCSQIFNNLEARGAITVEERNRLIARTREGAKRVAKAYLEKMQSLADRVQSSV